MGYEDEDFSGRCAAILSNGKRCPNAALPNSRYCGLPAHQALADLPTDEVAPAASNGAEAAPPEDDVLTGTAPEDDDVLVESSDEVSGEDDEPAPYGVVPPEAADFAEGTDLGPDREDPGTPSGAADSANVPDGASIGQEPELDETDTEGEYEAADA